MAAFGISSSYTKKSAAGGGGGGDGSTSRAERAERRQDGVRASVGSSGDKHLKQTTITSSGNLQLVVLRISNNIFTETTNIGNTLTVDTAILCIKFCRQ
jgi:hypothetical protein